MTIRPHISIYFNAALFIVSVTAAAIMFFSISSVIAAGVIFGIGILSLIHYLLAFARYIKLDATGIRISFLFVEKHFSWDNVVGVSKFDARNCLGYRSSLGLGLEIFLFSPSRPKWLDPGSYCLTCHPFKYIFFSFNGTERQPKDIPNAITYPVDGTLLLSLLQEWGISVQ